jgi:hypothetical protein
MLRVLQYSSLARLVPSLNLPAQYHGGGKARVEQKPSLSRLRLLLHTQLRGTDPVDRHGGLHKATKGEWTICETKIIASTTHTQSTGLVPPGSPIPHVPNETNVVSGAAGSFFLTSSWTKAAVVQSSQKKLRIKKTLECSLLWHSIYGWLLYVASGTR